jgi:hypothetical protein
MFAAASICGVSAMTLRVQSNQFGSFDLLWNEDVVAVIESKDAADELREALWLLPHLSIATSKCIEILHRLEALKESKTDADQKFILDTNFILDLIKKQNLYIGRK